MTKTLTFGKVVHGGDLDDSSDERHCSVFIDGEEVGEFYRETGMTAWAADASIEAIFGENVLDGHPHIRQAQAMARKLWATIQQ